MFPVPPILNRLSRTGKIEMDEFYFKDQITVDKTKPKPFFA